MTAEPFFLLLGAAGYALGWIYLPDTRFFRRWVETRETATQLAAANAEVASFSQKRDALLRGLGTTRRERYASLSQVCQDIEASNREDPLADPNPGADSRLRKLDELMWAFLRLLTIEESLERHLERERRDNIPALREAAEQEARELSAEFEAMKKQGAATPVLDAREKLINSRLERLEALRQRQQKSEQVLANQKLARAEQERLEQQIKLIRDDTLAMQNTGTLSARIDASVEHLAHTNQWLAEMEDFRDLAGGLPDTPVRVGYAVNPPPPPLMDRRTISTPQ